MLSVPSITAKKLRCHMGGELLSEYETIISTLEPCDGELRRLDYCPDCFTKLKRVPLYWQCRNRKQKNREPIALFPLFRSLFEAGESPSTLFGLALLLERRRELVRRGIQGDHILFSHRSDESSFLIKSHDRLNPEELEAIERVLQ